MKLESLQDLYLSELSDVYNAENQFAKALPKWIERTTSAELRQALQEHLKETQEQTARLDQVFGTHNEVPKKQKSRGMEGLLIEGEDMVIRDAAPAVRDAAIISAVQRAKHYEIAVYGAVRTYAEQLGHSRAAEWLKTTLNEERAANDKLTAIAARRTNVGATRTA